MGVIDFNNIKMPRIPDYSGISKVNHAYRSYRILSGDGSPTKAHISPLCAEIQWRPQGEKLRLPRPISGDGICSTDLSGEFTRDSHLSALPEREALPYGDTGRSLTQHTLQRQQGEGLANLRRLRSSTDQQGKAAICRRGSGDGSRQHGLRARCIHHRPLFITVSVGQISFHQVRSEATHPAQSAGQYTHLHRHYRWKGTRCQCAGYLDDRARRILHHGSRLSRFWQAFQNSPQWCLLRDSSQGQYTVQAAILQSNHRRGEGQRSQMRPDHCTDRSRVTAQLSRAATADQIPRQGDRQDLQLPDQQLHSTCTGGCRPLQAEMAGGALFQMDVDSYNKRNIQIVGIAGTRAVP